jgi:hypothetical protein
MDTRPPTPKKDGLYLTFVEDEIGIGDTRRNSHGDRKKKSIQPSACGQTAHRGDGRQRSHVRRRWRLHGAFPANSIYIRDCGAVAYVPGIRVTAQVRRTHVRRLQAGVPGPRLKDGRFVNVQTPRLRRLYS